MDKLGQFEKLLSSVPLSYHADIKNIFGSLMEAYAEQYEMGMKDQRELILNAVQPYTKRSSYSWSTGGAYSPEDERNEGALRMANTVVLLLKNKELL